jgi:hypothetical protein
MNKRADVPLVQKHNEALLLLPRLFSENGFSTVVTDPPWANYSWISDIRIYHDYPGIQAYNTKQKYTDIWLDRSNFTELAFKSTTLKRNFFWLSLFRIAPLLLRDGVYDNGDWWNVSSADIDFRMLLDSYAVLDFLPELTDTNTVHTNTFTFIQNELTHEPNFLQAPGYIPLPTVTDRGGTIYADISGYPVSAAAIKRLGEWLLFLKQNNVYDNTRIIITSDHGRWIDLGIFTDDDTLPFMREEYNPLLLVKDFNATGQLETDRSFMTNADVPTIALSGLIQNPVNPFSGRAINNDAKKQPVKISISPKWMPNEHAKNTFKIESGEWYYVQDTIFDAKNWRRAE